MGDFEVIKEGDSEPTSHGCMKKKNPGLMGQLIICFSKNLVPLNFIFNLFIYFPLKSSQ